MPQSSPMNWTILSLIMISSIMYTLSSNNSKMNNTNMLKTNFKLNMMSWKW